MAYVVVVVVAQQLFAYRLILNRAYVETNAGKCLNRNVAGQSYDNYVTSKMSARHMTHNNVSYFEIGLFYTCVRNIQTM